jgi:hypothetical protein
VLWKFRRERGRKDQQDETLATVTLHRDWFCERVNADAVCRYEDAGEAVRAIQQYLLP